MVRAARQPRPQVCRGMRCGTKGRAHSACACLPASPAAQALDPHANEYMERLKDEAVLLALAQKVGAGEGGAVRQQADPGARARHSPPLVPCAPLPR